MTRELYEINNKEYNNFFQKNFRPKNYEQGRTFIDIYFENKKGEKYFVELKYKLEEIPLKVLRHNKDLGNFSIKQQGAGNICRYNIYRDIERMENIKNVIIASHL